MYGVPAHKSAGLTLTNVENSNLVYPPHWYDAVGVASLQLRVAPVTLKREVLSFCHRDIKENWSLLKY